MPKRTDIHTILVIGSGPIVIGQACEFDYSGAQACKVLRAEGYRVVLVNSNPATIMTDPGLADRTYIEPITAAFVEKVIAAERPDALLPTLGGQTGLNTAVELAEAGVLDRYGVEMIGCDLAAIKRGEDRQLFNECMNELGIETAHSGYAYSVADARAIADDIGYPVVLRPSYTLGGAGGGIARNLDELELIVSQGIELSPVGEVMAIGRTFEEALGKALRSLENGRSGLGVDGHPAASETKEGYEQLLARPTCDRIVYVGCALRRGWTVDEVNAVTGIDRFFLSCMADIIAVQEALRDTSIDDVDADAFWVAKRYGLSDVQIAFLTHSSEIVVRTRRKALGVVPAFKTVDTCAAEFASSTAYHYKTYDADETEVARKSSDAPANRPKAVILGAGPNRIGQGIEFDYCCVHASYALHEAGYETIMVNCNPETVSTDYDTSDKLYFEPLTYEDVMDIIDAEKPDGVVVTLGGQTPLKLANALAEAGVHLMGTSPEAIDLAEDRDRFATVLDNLGIAYPPAGDASTFDEALRVASSLGFPLLVRPSYVLGGRGMAIVYDTPHLEQFMGEAARISPDHPVYLDKFLESAIEVDLDCISDGTDVYIGGVLEHIEEAGIHSGDSACCIPPFSLSDGIVTQLRDIAHQLALALGVRGLLNIQFAIKDQVIYVIEANPRASRTVPFVSKATGVPLAKIAARVMAGEMLADMGLPADDRTLGHFAVKEAVMPFGRFPGSDVVLGPEMKSTGEVMGIASTFPAAYAKTQLAISYDLPTEGTVFISVADRDKRAIVSIARDFVRLGFEVASTGGTAKVLAASGVPCKVVRKVSEPSPNIGDMIVKGEVQLMINTPFGHGTRSDGYELRLAAVRHGVTYATTIAAAQAFAEAMEVARFDGLGIIALQDLPQY